MLPAVDELEIQPPYLHYIEHGDGNRFSKYGKIRVEVAGDSPEALGRAVGKLKDLGLDSRLASPADMECLYLSKVTYAAGYADQVRIAPETPVAERVKAYREFWAKKLNARDLTKLPGYSPEPEFARDRGWARWNRFDVDRDEFERRMRGYSLGHSLHEDRAKAIERILDSQGSLVATEEKLRIGVPVKGMSPQRDQETGGASYVFTRIAPPGREKRFDLVFDKRLLLDPDTISYDGDHFGRVEPDFLKKHRKRTVGEWIETSRKSGNETLVRNNVPLVEYLEQVNVRDAAERRKVLDAFKRHGVTTIRGRRVEDVVKVTQ